MIEYIHVVKKRPANKATFDLQIGASFAKKRTFELQAGAHLRVYIGGKITGDAGYREKFGKAETVLSKIGHCVMNPAKLPSGMEQGDYMRICFSMIDCADVVVLLPDWQESAGARLERAYAEKIGKEVVVADQRRIDEYLRDGLE
jgi:hypothetical protein